MKETRKTITTTELEQLMTSKKGIFSLYSVDTCGVSFTIVGNRAYFEKSNGHACMVVECKSGEIQIDFPSIKEIYLDGDRTITIVFNKDLPDLKIKY